MKLKTLFLKLRERDKGREFYAFLKVKVTLMQSGLSPIESVKQRLCRSSVCIFDVKNAMFGQGDSSCLIFFVNVTIHDYLSILKHKAGIVISDLN